MDDMTKALASNILGDIKTSLRGAYDSYTQEEKDLIEACSKDAAMITLRKLAGEDVATQQREIDAQLANIKVAGMGSFASLLWGVVGKLLSLATSALMARA